MAQAIHEMENGQVLVRCPDCGWERIYEDNRNPAGRCFEQTWDTRARAEKGFQVHLQKAHHGTKPA